MAESVKGFLKGGGGMLAFECSLTCAVFVAGCAQLCEGHTQVWQDLMREQPGATADVDLVTEIANKLGQLACKNGPCWYVIVYWDAWYSGATVFSALATLIQVRGACTRMHMLDQWRGAL